MLSSVAERVYWLGRYMERVESSARLLDVYSSMLFDLPRGSHIDWGLLLDITGSYETFEQNGVADSELNVVRFLVADTNNPSSIISCLKMLRENARTTREIIPSEAWEEINVMYLQAKASIASGIGRQNRHEIFEAMIEDCQRLEGLLSGSMARNTAYTFIQIGKMLERSDMTSRIVDVGSIALLPAFAKMRKKEANLQETYENVVWMNILRSVGGYQAYRQNVANRVQGEGVVRFLLQDDEFPKAINFCLEYISNHLEHLPNHEDVQLAVDRVKRITSEANVFHLLETGLLEYIDELQISLADIHVELSKVWFGYDPESQVEVISAPETKKPAAKKKTPVKKKTKAPARKKAKAKKAPSRKSR